MVKVRRRKVGGVGSGVSVKKVDKKQDKRIRKLEDLVGNPEFKVHSSAMPTAVNGVPVQSTNAMIIVPLTDVAAGQGGSSRIGDKILVKNLEFRCEAFHNINRGNQFARFVCFVDRGYDETLTTTPTGSDVLLTYSVVDGSTDNLMSILNPDSFTQKYDVRKTNMSKNYKLIFDYRIPIGTISTNGTAIHYMRKYNKSMNQIVNYNGSEDLGGRIWLAVFPGNATTNTNNAFLNWWATIAYLDM